MLRYAIALFLVQVSVTVRSPSSQFRVIKEWNYINYTWPSDISREIPLVASDYIPQNNLISGINYYEGYYYLAIPRMKIGIPVTLARINAANPRSAPILEPFPSWEMNLLGNCSALQNVQNVAIDAKGKMWIIDGGKTSTLTKYPNTTCSPKLLIYDFKTGMITTSYNFTEDVANKTLSFLYDIVVDNTDGGYAYIADNSRVDPGLIVYSLQQNRAWKIRDSKSMLADPDAVNFRINDVVIRAPINLAGIALGPKTNINEQNITLNEDREVFYCPISSLHLYSTRTSYLKDENNSRLEDGEFNKYVKDIGIKSSQTDGMKMDNKGVLYYGLLSTTSIARWDSSTPFSSEQQVISKDEKYIQWPNSFAFDDDGNILVLTNNLEKYIQGSMLLSEPNFRILMAYVGTKSYVFDDDTLVYSVYETDNQNITSSTTPTSTTTKMIASSEKPIEIVEIDMEASTKKVDVEYNARSLNNTGEITIEAAPNSACLVVRSSIIVMVCLCLHQLLLFKY